jgi:hypothetical protein
MIGVVTVRDLFFAKFGICIEVNSEAQKDIKLLEMDSWWKENHAETPTEYENRMNYENRPIVGFLIKV